jgi:hypothetical protein
MNDFTITGPDVDVFLHNEKQPDPMPTVFILHVSYAVILIDNVTVEWFTHQSGLSFNSQEDAERFAINYGEPGSCFTILEYAPIPF